MFRSRRVEQFHGDLDEHFSKDQLASLISILRYSTDDQRRGHNPSNIPFEGDIRNNLASYRNAVERYRRFRLEANDVDGIPVPVGAQIAEVNLTEDLGQRIGLERDMQASLRQAISELQPDLTIIDDGAERKVESGFIDITARDASGVTVVIELKAGVAKREAVAQILSYMGDIAAEDESQKVRGILVASEFDARTKSAARMVPELLLRRYSIKFRFFDT